MPRAIINGVITMVGKNHKMIFTVSMFSSLGAPKTINAVNVEMLHASIPAKCSNNQFSVFEANRVNDLILKIYLE
jgi:hypothetical protein